MNVEIGQYSARTPILTVMALSLVWLCVPLVASAQESAGDEMLDGKDAVEIEDAQQTSWAFSARIRPRLEGRFNHQFGLGPGDLNYGFQPDESNLFTQQSRLGARVERRSLSGQLTLQHTAVWGAYGGNELTAPPLSIYEASMRYQARDMVFVEAGRFELAYGDQKVLGAVGWSQVGRAWDGVRVGIRPTDSIDVDVFTARYEVGAAGFLDEDGYLSGIYTTVDDPFGAVVEVADLYLLHDLDLGASPVVVDDQITDAGRQRQMLVMLGTRWKAGVADADLSVEGAYQLGTRCGLEPGAQDCIDDSQQNISAFFVDLEAGYSIADLRPFVGTSLATGDDPDSETYGAYDPMYPTGHAQLGYMDLVGPRTNIFEMRGGLQWRYQWFRQELSFHNFTRLQPVAQTVGNEINTKLSADLGDSFGLGAGYGLFVPDEGMSATDDEPQGLAHWVFVQAQGSF